MQVGSLYRADGPGVIIRMRGLWQPKSPTHMLPESTQSWVPPQPSRWVLSDLVQAGRSHAMGLAIFSSLAKHFSLTTTACHDKRQHIIYSSKVCPVLTISTSPCVQFLLIKISHSRFDVSRIPADQPARAQSEIEDNQTISEETRDLFTNLLVSA